MGVGTASVAPRPTPHFARGNDPSKQVEEENPILLQAKGARWVIVGLAGVAGLASGLIAKLIP
jgi:hypothetical protein